MTLVGPRPGVPEPDQLGDLWVAVTRAGGAVGFSSDDPEPDIRAAAAQAVVAVQSGTQHMVGVWRGRAQVGAVFLVPQRGQPLRHRASVIRLMTHPALQRQGWGARLLSGAVDRARELGLTQLELHARAGQGLEGFYAAAGWTEVGRWRSSLRISPDDVRDDLWFARDI